VSFLLDTDICSAYLKGNNAVFGRFIQYGGRLHISVATLGELWTWALRANAPARRLQGLTALLTDVVVLDATAAVARKFGEVEAQMLDEGLSVTEFDLLIAATALTHDLTLVTHNVQDFVHVPALAIEDWLAP
jgi:predicted nucleic acid-binding protein